MDVPSYRVTRAFHSGHSLTTAGWPSFEHAEYFDFRKIRHEPEDDQPLLERTQFASLWDEFHLYLTFTIFDADPWATITRHDERLFSEECVEVFIDPDGDGRRYIEVQINRLGTIRDLLIDGTIPRPAPEQYDRMAAWHFGALRKEIADLRDEGGNLRGWKLRMAISWTEFGFSRRPWPPRRGDELRINFYRYERPRSKPGSLELSGWSRVDGSFHQPHRFGRFIFRSSRDDR